MNTAYLVSVLLKSRLVLQVGSAGRQPACLCIDVQAAMNAAQVAVFVQCCNLTALQWPDEVAEQGINGS